MNFKEFLKENQDYEFPTFDIILRAQDAISEFENGDFNDEKLFIKFAKIFNDYNVRFSLFHMSHLQNSPSKVKKICDSIKYYGYIAFPKNEILKVKLDKDAALDDYMFTEIKERELERIKSDYRADEIIGDLLIVGYKTDGDSLVVEFDMYLIGIKTS